MKFTQDKKVMQNKVYKSNIVSCKNFKLRFLV